MVGVRGSRILIAEDEYPVAADLSRYFRSMGAIVVGPVPTVAMAQEMSKQVDAAILDIDLNGETIFPVADELLRRHVPFVFFSGRGGAAIPERFRHVGHLAKPVSWSTIFRRLFQAPGADGKDGTWLANVNGEGEEDLCFSDEVVSLLPKLRLSARLIMGDAQAADRLVEATLERAILDVGTRPDNVSLEKWLGRMLDENYARRGSNLMQ